MQILQFHYNLIVFLNYNNLQTIPGSVSQSTEVDTTENFAIIFFFFFLPFNWNVTKTFHDIHRLLPQQIFLCVCYRTVNKYQFIKPQYLCFFSFLWETCCLTIYCIYLYIVQIYLCIRDIKIQNIYSVLFWYFRGCWLVRDLSNLHA